ncbi:MAG: Na/Pi cotransporter family protein [Eubacterium sp.]|jgi:Na/Pi-cotransporter|nr:Na/Pi cotransporter family protein [Eubacterium sp.]
MKDTMQILFGLLGGLAVFIFGMNMMSECLQKAAGEKMKSILALLTKNPVMGVLAGALTTAVLQSSSATTVMAIGFVSAGLMSLPQSISIILGANIGTTMTAQIIAFKISDYIYLFIFAGFAVSYVAKTEKVKNIGQTVFAFGLLFLGIETMGTVMKPLAGSPFFLNMIERVAHIPVLGVLTGTFMTLVVQSSSATIAVLQNFAQQAGADGVTSILGLAGAIPILLGDNVGTTITALLASVGQAKDAKRTALAHCIFNLSGCFLFIWLIQPFAALIRAISPAGPEVAVISRQIANAHTMFNLVMTLIWTPLLPYMVKLVTGLIREGAQAPKAMSEPFYLDNKLVMQPAAALQLAEMETVRCGELANTLLEGLAGSVKAEDVRLTEAVLENTGQVRSLYERVTEYLSELFSSGSMSEEQAHEAAGILYLLGDLDRIVFLCQEILEQFLSQSQKKNKARYSKEARKELEQSLILIRQMYGEAFQMLLNGERDNLKKIRKKKEKMLDLSLHMRKAHLERVEKGKCSVKLTKPFYKILNALDRLSNGCANIADHELTW